MTDKEFNELKQNLANLDKEYSIKAEESHKKWLAGDNKAFDWTDAFRNKQLDLIEKIDAEEKRRILEVHPDYEEEEMKSCLEHYNKHHKPSKELWYALIGDEKKIFESDKGKYVWTSRNRAINAVCNMLERMDYSVINKKHIDVLGAVNKLIDKGYIEIKQFM